VHHLSLEATFVSEGPLAVWVWRKPANASMIRELRSTLAALAAANPGGAGIVTVVGRGASVPGDDIRRGIVDACREVTGVVRGGAVCYLGDDLAAALVRGVVTGLLLLGRDIYPHSVFRSIDDASTWLARQVGPASLPPHEISACVERARALRA